MIFRTFQQQPTKLNSCLLSHQSSEWCILWYLWDTLTRVLESPEGFSAHTDPSKDKDEWNWEHTSWQLWWKLSQLDLMSCLWQLCTIQSAALWRFFGNLSLSWQTSRRWSGSKRLDSWFVSVRLLTWILSKLCIKSKKMSMAIPSCTMSHFSKTAVVFPELEHRDSRNL